MRTCMYAYWCGKTIWMQLQRSKQICWSGKNWQLQEGVREFTLISKSIAPHLYWSKPQCEAGRAVNFGESLAANAFLLDGTGYKLQRQMGCCTFTKDSSRTINGFVYVHVHWKRSWAPKKRFRDLNQRGRVGSKEPFLVHSCENMWKHVKNVKTVC